ncbi:MAG TPA: choice-of-anchor Q domain-containing protein [Solirubrobacter sp.]|nr:choice-of-anchor Q domain-containing protein [Solirubrobacter sp.]
MRAVLIAGLASLALTAPAQADTWTVTDGSSDSSAACNTGTHQCVSLRAAIAASEATKGTADTINVPAGTITVGSDLVIQSEMTINGTSARTNVIDGGGKNRGFRVTANGKATITHFTVRNGAANQGGSSDGGGILNQGTTALDTVHVTGSRAANGGGIANAPGGLLSVQHSLVDGNTAESTGGGIANVGGPEASPITYVALGDSTVSANTAGIGGAGGIASRNAGALLAVLRSTIADNVGGVRGTGGLEVNATARAQVTGSIVARNLVSGATLNCNTVKPTDGGANVEDDKQCAFDLGGVDPGLDKTLKDAGGELDVLALSASSPAVDRLAVGDSCKPPLTDQRGLYRPQGAACDAGAYELDQAATLTITTGPSGTVADADVTFQFSASEPGISPVCRLSGPGQSGGFTACYKSNAQPYSGLANGTYTFSVRDAAFPSGPVASRTFTVAALDTTITSGPAGPTNDATPAFTFTASEAGATFECQVDGGRFTACTSPFTLPALADGPHAFAVRAIDVTGKVDSTPATRDFTVDTTPPAAPVVTGGPDGATTDASPAFTFTATETVSCRLDGPDGVAGTFAPCASPETFSGLRPGAYVFTVRSVDAAGNQQTTSRAFTVTLPQQATPAPTPSPTPTVTPTATPGPVAGKSVGAKPVGGTVLVKQPGSNTFVPLSPSVIRLGAEIDARHGKVELTRADGGRATFFDGIFKLTESGGYTTLTLTQKLSCPKPRRAHAAAKKVKSRKLWGDGKGRFRTKGQYSAATVRGTKWLVQDTCTSTLTRVAAGVVAVQDFAKHKTIALKKGKRYTARPKRR